MHLFFLEKEKRAIIILILYLYLNYMLYVYRCWPINKDCRVEVPIHRAAKATTIHPSMLLFEGLRMVAPTAKFKSQTNRERLGKGQD